MILFPSFRFYFLQIEHESLSFQQGLRTSKLHKNLVLLRLKSFLRELMSLLQWHSFSMAEQFFFYLNEKARTKVKL